MESLLWWHWIVIGIVLILLELVVPAFAIFWFGLGAILTGLLLAALPELSLAWQLLVFSLSSVAFVVLWFRVWQPRRRARSLPADERSAIGQTGIAATRALTPGELGRVVFSVPVMGDEAWDYVADQPVQTGERLRVIAVLDGAAGGKVLKVEKVG
jgi:inner membrane protein